MSIRLSDRLQAVSHYVPQGARLLDVGSDHAYLPIALTQEGRLDFAIAGEVVQGPFEAAQANVSQFQLDERIAVRLADGLAAHKAADQIDTIAICGMGGGLIAEILERGQDSLSAVGRLILQPNNREDDLRAWLAAHGYAIQTEEMVLDHGKYYEILVAEPGDMTLDALDMRFGPVLRREQSAIFRTYWEQEADKLRLAFSRIPEENLTARQALADKLAAIKEVLA